MPSICRPCHVRKNLTANRQTNRIVACRSARHVAFSIDHESQDSKQHPREGEAQAQLNCLDERLVQHVEEGAVPVRELAPHGIRVFALAPPAILTEMTRFIMDDPGGRAWRPEFRQRFADGKQFQPASLVSRWTIDLLSGRADALSGRYFLATSDFEDVVRRTDAILRDDLLTLRIR